MSAKRLRQAAAEIRAKANDADSVRGPGTWHVETAWCDLTDSSYAVKSPGGTVAHGSCEEEAEHIALWHPAVALAVADWLDDTAATREDPYYRENYDDLMRPALAVAEAILGGAR